ncbi:MAG: ABC transporter permease [Gemmatimonadota bacterium]|nr:MAG: ABC transporter permease [Gemmatimonadota bacterium]
MAEWVYRQLLFLYPSDFRLEYGQGMLDAFRDRWDTERFRAPRWVALRVWLFAFRDLFASVFEERRYQWRAQFLGSRSSRTPRPPRTVEILCDAWRDVRYALRRLAHNPAFTLTAIVSLALGIGANSAIFTVVNAVLLRSDPFERPEELVDIYFKNPTVLEYCPFSIPDFEDLREGTRDVFAAVAGSQLTLAQADLDGNTEMLPAEMVSGEYFSALGVGAALGRSLLPEDDVAAGAHPVVVLGHRYWMRVFGEDPNVLGREVRLTGRAYTIVGVAPDDYRGRFSGISPAFFVPIKMINEIQPSTGDQLQNRGSQSTFVRGRLKPGATIEQARVSVAGVVARFREEYPSNWNANSGIILVPTEDVIIWPQIDRFIRAAAWLLMGVVGLVLFMACVNLASFLLARATDRRREIAMRLALGATRRGLVAQLLTETVVLGLLGGTVGVAVGVWLLKLLLAADLPLPVPLDLDLSLDTRVLGFTLAISLAAGVLFGLVPAVQSSKAYVAATLKDETAGGGRAGRITLRNTLVVVQVAVSLVLLAGAGLFLRSLAATLAVDPGFGRQPAAMFEVALPSNRLSREEGRVFLSTLFQRFEQIPGVEAVGLTGNLQLNTLRTQTIGVNVDGVTPPPGQEEHDIHYAEVDAGFFDATGIRILRGRNFTAVDREDAPQVAIISQAMADKFWPGEDALGRMLLRSEEEDLRVVGIASDAKVRSLGEAPRPFVYRPFSQDYTTFVTVVARTSRDPEHVVLELVAAAREFDSELLLWEPKTLQRHLGIVLLPARLSALLLSVFAVLALALASVGLYGIVSYAVSQRTREMGIRMSLGADGGMVVRMLVGGGMKLVAVGCVLGLVLALLVARTLSSLLFGISASDPLTFVAIPALLCGVAMLAAYFPARRASRIDPVRALRAE